MRCRVEAIGNLCGAALYKEIETQEENLREFISTKTDVDSSVAQLQKMYEDENIREIQETEEQSDLGVVPRATEEGTVWNGLYLVPGDRG